MGNGIDGADISVWVQGECIGNLESVSVRTKKGVEEFRSTQKAKVGDLIHFDRDYWRVTEVGPKFVDAQKLANGSFFEIYHSDYQIVFSPHTESLLSNESIQALAKAVKEAIDGDAKQRVEVVKASDFAGEKAAQESERARVGDVIAWSDRGGIVTEVDEEVACSAGFCARHGKYTIVKRALDKPMQMSDYKQDKKPQAQIPPTHVLVGHQKILGHRIYVGLGDGYSYAGFVPFGKTATIAGGKLVVEDESKIAVSVNGQHIGFADGMTVGADKSMCEKPKKRRAKLCDFCFESVPHTINIAGRAACDECLEKIRNDVGADLPDFELVAMLAKREGVRRLTAPNKDFKLVATTYHEANEFWIAPDLAKEAEYGPATILVIPEAGE